MTRFINGWAIPRTRNAQHNWGLLGDFRMPLSMPQFRPGSKDVLGETLSTEEMADLCIEHNVGIVPTTLIHDSGSTNGTGYHGSHGNGRGPYLSVASARRFGREQASYFKQRGVKVEAFEFGNELEYSPRHNDDHVGYLDQVIDQALAFRAAVRDHFHGIEVIIGGNHGKASSHGGRKTLAQRLRERDLVGAFTLDIHGNAKEISTLVDEIQWCRSKGFRVAVLEDRGDGPHNDAFNRSKAFAQAGAVWVGQFGSRNVNAEGDNPNCRWGVSGNKPTRRTGAAWTCAGWQPEEYDRLLRTARWCGNSNPGEPLPDDTDGDPVDPPIDPPVDPPGGSPHVPGQSELRAAMEAAIAGDWVAYRAAIQAWYGIVGLPVSDDG